ncbi:enoyl-CoA hydratase-related protein [soil metagenome]
MIDQRTPAPGGAEACGRPLFRIGGSKEKPAAASGSVTTVSETLLRTHDGAVTTLTLNRPESMNSLDVPTKEALLVALRQAAEDPAVRAVVLTGNGRGFCVGQDLKETIRLVDAGDPAPLSTVAEHYNPIVTAITGMPKPVIAAVNGMAAGAGASFAFAADFRVAGQGAAFLMAFARIGLSVDSGATWTLPRLIGHAKAAELMMLARPVDAETALALGMVTEVVPDEEVGRRAAELAAELAAGPTLAYAAIKAALAFSATHGLAESLAHEGEQIARTGRTEDHRSAVQAFVHKTKAVFTGR